MGGNNRGLSSTSAFLHTHTHTPSYTSVCLPPSSRTRTAPALHTQHCMLTVVAVLHQNDKCIQPPRILKHNRLLWNAQGRFVAQEHNHIARMLLQVANIGMVWRAVTTTCEEACWAIKRRQKQLQAPVQGGTPSTLSASQPAAKPQRTTPHHTSACATMLSSTRTPPTQHNKQTLSAHTMCRLCCADSHER